MINPKGLEAFEAAYAASCSHRYDREAFAAGITAYLSAAHPAHVNEAAKNEHVDGDVLTAGDGLEEHERRMIAFYVKREIRVAFRKALADLPEIAPPEISVLLSSVHMSDAFFLEGKRLQREHGTDAVALGVEQECAAGVWSFMRQGVAAALNRQAAKEGQAEAAEREIERLKAGK